MIEYQKLNWVDEIKDQFGNIIRDGTPLSAKNHNRMEDGIAAAIMGVNNNIEAIRETIPSGFTKLGDLDYIYMNTNPNKIKLSASVAFVNGWKVTIPDGTIIELRNPPTEGDREDLVFLECWLDQTTKELKSRIRVVDGVDFVNFPRDGISVSSGYGWLSPNYPKATPQGGNANPLTFDNSTGGMSLTTSFNTVNVMNTNGSSLPLDNGLYLSGRGTQQSKDILKTFDGFVYAIPMFRIWRRNSSPFSDVNPNGGSLRSLKDYNVVREYQSIVSNSWTLELDNISDIYVGDLFTRTDLLRSIDKLGYSYLSRVESIQNNIVTFRNVRSISAWNMSSVIDGFNKITKLSTSTRPDSLLSDIVDKSDLIDLRHQVLVHDYEQLLAINFEKALRGELQTNQYNDMMKTYHGIRKTPIDANTVFYYSGDGNKDPELGSKFKDVENNLKFNFYNSTTGLGVSNASKLAVSNFNTFIENEGTLDFWIDFSGLSKHSSGYTGLISLYENEAKRFFTVYHKHKVDGSLSTLYFEYFFTKSDGSETYDSLGIDYNAIRGGFHHIRINWKGSKISSYVDGNLSDTRDFLTSNRVRSKCNTIIIHGNSAIISDLSISNIDRVDTFATLPKDFIDGYAKIMPAFNEQRWCYSDALTSEFKQEVIKAASPSTYPRYIKVTQASGNWAAGDKIAIKGLCGEIISGVIDTDTTLGKIISYIDSNNLILDSVDKLSVNDNIVFYDPLNNFYDTQAPRTISAINTTTKQITFSLGLDKTAYESGYNTIIEVTANSSVPTIKFNTTNITGTWSGLGTNEVIFTFGTNAGLTNQNIIVEYSLIEPQGQGAFSDVLYQTLGGEVNGKKLIRSEGPHIIDDFRGKISGSVTENPHVMREGLVDNKLALPNDSRWIESATSFYTQMYYYNDGKINAQTRITGAVGMLPQQLMSFNIVDIIEKKYGPIPVMDKINWCRGAIYNIELTHYGYGYLTPCSTINDSGNKELNWRGSDGWAENGTKKDKSPKVMSINTNNYNAARPKNCIDDNGFIHFMLYGDAATTTESSTIYTDYVSISVTIQKPSSEYDVICPLNLRKDDGLGTIAFIRKETNELRFPFKAPINAITYGNYGVYQGAQILPKVGLYPLTDWKVIATSIGTGSYDAKGNSWAKLYMGLYNLPMYNKDDMAKYYGSPIKILGKETSITRVGYHNASIGSWATVLFNPIGGVALQDKYYRGWKLDNFIGVSDAENGVYGIHPDVQIDGSYYLVAARLVKDSQGNILMLISKSLGDTLCNDGGSNASDTFYLSGRPLEFI